VGDGLVLISAWESLVRNYAGLHEELKQKYMAHLKRQDAAPFSSKEIKELSQAGFLTGSTSVPTSSDTFLRPDMASLGTLQYVANAGSQYAAGSGEATAAGAVEHIAGGTGASNRMSLSSSTPTSCSFSLPNMGPYLKLLVSARDHLFSILSKSNAHKTMELERLRERWDGGAADKESEKHDRKGLLPGKTKKWRTFYGLTFEWVLAECIGAGLVECFQTGSIGLAVRAL